MISGLTTGYWLFCYWWLSANDQTTGFSNRSGTQKMLSILKGAPLSQNPGHLQKQTLNACAFFPIFFFAETHFGLCPLSHSDSGVHSPDISTLSTVTVITHRSFLYTITSEAELHVCQ